MARGKTAGRYTPRRSGGGDEGGSDRWLGTYADMVTLLMAFFVMLYAMSEIDAVKFAAFVKGLETPFGNAAAESMLPESEGLLPDREGLSPDESPPPTPERIELPEEVVADVQRREEAEDRLDEISRALHEALAEDGLDHLVEQRREERGLVVSVASDDVLFALASTKVSDLGRQVIRTVARTLDGYPNPLLIEGHTDDLPLRRHDYTNWNLSTDRAVAVLELMVERHELPPDRVGAVGYGEHRPLVENQGAQTRARNRRVDIVVLVEEIL